MNLVEHIQDPFEPGPQNRVFYTLTASPVFNRTVAADKEELLEQVNLQGLWPERLLHVESTVSYKREERSDGVFYNGIKEPRFSIVSYKWGMWVTGDGPTLQVKGIDWDPPSIDQRYFTVADQIRLLQRMSEDVQFVWIDVGCISQLLEEDTLREIIIEPQYFKQASTRFIWWVDFSSDTLQRLLDAVDKARSALDQMEASDGDEKDLILAPPILAEVFQPLRELMAIAWFSSNWTLREIMLCSNVIILNREGNVVLLEGGPRKRATIDVVAALCVQILEWLQRIRLRQAKGNWRFPEPEGANAEGGDQAKNKLPGPDTESDLAAAKRESRRTASMRVSKVWSRLTGSSKSSGMSSTSHDTRPSSNTSISQHGTDMDISIVQDAHEPRASSTCGYGIRKNSILHMAAQYLHLVQEHGPFFLYCSSPSTLNYWTRALLETGRLLTQGVAGRQAHFDKCFEVYHGWGDGYVIDCECWRLCTCTGQAQHHEFECGNTYQTMVCIPCVLGMTLEVKGHAKVHAHTPITLEKAEIEARTGVKLVKPKKFHSYEDRAGDVWHSFSK